MKTLCQIFKSSRQAEMYLYVDREKGLERVPAALLSKFGEPVEVMTLVLTPERKLARVSAADVLESISAHGFFLQMPPSAEELLRREGNSE